MRGFDQGFAAGLKAASDMARKSAVALARRARPAKFEAAAKVCAELADAFDEAAAAPAVPVKVVVVDTLSTAPAPAPAESPEAARASAKAKGYTGDECRECGSFSMVRNGTCLKCENCGSTTGCS